MFSLFDQAIVFEKCTRRNVSSDVRFLVVATLQKRSQWTMVPFQGNRYIALQNAFRMEYSLKKMEIFDSRLHFLRLFPVFPLSRYYSLTQFWFKSASLFALQVPNFWPWIFWTHHPSVSNSRSDVGRVESKIDRSLVVLLLLLLWRKDWKVAEFWHVKACTRFKLDQNGCCVLLIFPPIKNESNYGSAGDSIIQLLSCYVS